MWKKAIDIMCIVIYNRGNLSKTKLRGYSSICMTWKTATSINKGGFLLCFGFWENYDIIVSDEVL